MAEASNPATSAMVAAPIPRALGRADLRSEDEEEEDELRRANNTIFQEGKATLLGRTKKHAFAMQW
jgi:hypothetical protein